MGRDVPEQNNSFREEHSYKFLCSFYFDEQKDNAGHNKHPPVDPGLSLREPDSALGRTRSWSQIWTILQEREERSIDSGFAQFPRWSAESMQHRSRAFWIHQKLLFECGHFYVPERGLCVVIKSDLTKNSSMEQFPLL